MQNKQVEITQSSIMEDTIQSCYSQLQYNTTPCSIRIAAQNVD